MHCSGQIFSNCYPLERLEQLFKAGLTSGQTETSVALVHSTAGVICLAACVRSNVPCMYCKAWQHGRAYFFKPLPD